MLRGLRRWTALKDCPGRSTKPRPRHSEWALNEPPSLLRMTCFSAGLPCCGIWIFRTEYKSPANGSSDLSAGFSSVTETFIIVSPRRVICAFARLPMISSGLWSHSVFGRPDISRAASIASSVEVQM